MFSSRNLSLKQFFDRIENCVKAFYWFWRNANRIFEFLVKFQFGTTFLRRIGWDREMRQGMCWRIFRARYFWWDSVVFRLNFLVLCVFQSFLRFLKALTPFSLLAHSQCLGAFLDQLGMGFQIDLIISKTSLRLEKKILRIFCALTHFWCLGAFSVP